MMSVHQKSGWKTQTGYIWSMIGSAVGFANILGFSAKCYFNGGGAFLIPMIVALMCFGVPLLILEGVVGQVYQLPLVSALRAGGGKLGAFFGWMTVLGVTTIGGYYLVINAWSIAYVFFSLKSMIPVDTASFFAYDFLKDPGTILAWGSFSWSVFFPVILVALFTWFVTVRTIQKGIEVVCEIFLPLLGILLVGFLIAVCFLPGACTGFYYYLVPRFSALYDPQLWLISFGHVFFSLSVGLALIVGYSRYVDKDINITHAMCLVALGDLLTSLVAGFVIFGGIGYMAHLLRVPFQEVVTSSVFGLGFVVFPKIFQTFPSLVQLIVAPLFFFCLFIAGITGLFSIVEAVAGNFEVEFSWKRSRAVTLSLVLITALSCIFSFGNGSYIIGTLDGMTAGFNVLISGIMQIIIFMYCMPQVVAHSAWQTRESGYVFYYYTLKYLSPLLLLGVFIMSLYGEFQTAQWFDIIIRWGWFTTACGLSLVLVLAKDRWVRR